MPNAPQKKITSQGTITIGDNDYGHSVTFPVNLNITGSTTASYVSNAYSQDLTVTSGSWLSLNTSSMLSVNLYVIQNKGTASFMIAGTSTGGALTNPILDPGDFMVLSYSSASKVPALYAQALTT